MNLLLFAILATAVPAIFGSIANGRSLVQDLDQSNMEFISWYNCSLPGIYPDDTSCEHFIRCIPNPIGSESDFAAWRHQCAPIDTFGNHQYYVRDSGPDDTKACCDDPDKTECPIQTTTTPRTPDECLDVEPGAECDPEDCEECGDCDWYKYCDRDTHRWVLNGCQYRAEADGTVLVHNKLFWNKGGNVHGGACVPWTSLKSEMQDEYLNDADCKPVCEYWADNSTVPCLRDYWFQKPDMAQDIWYAPAIKLSCGEGTKWVNDVQTCTWCDDGENCTC